MKNIHRLIKYKQTGYMNTKNVNMNTRLRQKARNNFEKGFFKLINNAVFGKTMENVRR